MLVLVLLAPAAIAGLPFDTVFRGSDRFQALVRRADEENWKALPIGERACAVGRALVGTPYQSFTLEIDDHIEAPSVNLNGLDCWTFFETSLAFARMLESPARTGRRRRCSISSNSTATGTAIAPAATSPGSITSRTGCTTTTGAGWSGTSPTPSAASAFRTRPPK